MDKRRFTETVATRVRKVFQLDSVVLFLSSKPEVPSKAIFYAAEEYGVEMAFDGSFFLSHDAAEQMAHAICVQIVALKIGEREFGKPAPVDVTVIGKVK
jgi:hypothetical protein